MTVLLLPSLNTKAQPMGGQGVIILGIAGLGGALLGKLSRRNGHPSQVQEWQIGYRIVQGPKTYTHTYILLGYSCLSIWVV